MQAPGAPQIVGRYRIYGKIAQGGMAAVHLARVQGAAGFSRTVAVKRLHPHLAEEPDFVSSLVDEARLAARIQHPNVVATLDVVVERGELLIVMEYVRGESLARLLKSEAERGKRAPLEVVSAIAVGALQGLHAAHEACDERGAPLGIVHRDVSPHNVLVGVDGIARVIDFGVAKAAGRLQTTREGVIKGKLAYMAPEQVAGAPVSRSADVYAMGVVLWEMLAWRRLFVADNDATLVTRVLSGACEPPSRYAPGLPPGLDALVMTALSRDPAARFASAQLMADALAALVTPALPSAVGAWVQQRASASLGQRAAELAQIESTSGVVPLPGVAPVAPVAAIAARASQPSIVSLEAPRSGLGPGAARRWRPWVVAVAALAAIAAGVALAVALARGPSAPQAATASGTAAAEAPPPPPPRAPGTSPPVVAAGAAPPDHGAGAASLPAGPPVPSAPHPAAAAHRVVPPIAGSTPRAPARSHATDAGMVRFATPD